MPQITQFQGWAVHISWCADHTYVACPQLNQVFNCWGQQFVPGQTFVCSGEGNYSCGNCYRCPVDLFGQLYPDTACIGVYGVDGVCHQSANCFLFTAGTCLNLSVRGYWLTLLAYGPYGTLFPEWLGYALAPCLLRSGAEVPGPEEVAAGHNASLPQQLRALYEGFRHGPKAPTHDEMLIRAAALVTRYYAPDIDPGHFRDHHAALLADKDEAVASGATGEELGTKLNEVAAKHQQILAQHLGPETYHRLTGFGADERFAIIEPGLERLTGIRPPRTRPQH